MLNRTDVEKIAHLARLGVSEQEIATYTEQLSRILGLIEQMNAVDTGKIVPLAHPHEEALRLREDEVSEADQRGRFLALAPAADAGLYLVPKVIE